jgi:hypothetical protein
MKNQTLILTALLLVFCLTASVQANDNVSIVTPTSEAAVGLDLQAVGELFAETKNLEDFEKALNNPEDGLNNLDLDSNGEVDYIRIVEKVEGDTHVIILQAAIGKDEFQDVATIEVEKVGNDYNMQIRGDALIYGANYYYRPLHVSVWPIFTWIYRPAYRPYHSRFYFGVYPRWWRPFHPVHISIYHKRTIRFTHRNTFVVAKTNHIRTINRVHYKPRRSTTVTKRVTVRRNAHASKKNTVKKSTTVKRKNGTTVKRTKKITSNKNGRKSTVKKTKVKKKKHN